MSAHTTVNPPAAPLSAQRRSTLVTVIAWIFIIFSVFTLLIMVFQMLIFAILGPQHELFQIYQGFEGGSGSPNWTRLYLDNIWGLFMGVVVFELARLASAFALLKRKNWGRLVFMTILAASVLLYILQLYWANAFFEDMMASKPGFQEPFMERFIGVMKTFMNVLTIAYAGLYLWIIKKLSSAEIKAEFGV